MLNSTARGGGKQVPKSSRDPPIPAGYPTLDGIKREDSLKLTSFCNRASFLPLIPQAKNLKPQKEDPRGGAERPNRIVHCFTKSWLESLNQDRDRTSSKAATARGAGIDGQQRARRDWGISSWGSKTGGEEEEGSDV